MNEHVAVEGLVQPREDIAVAVSITAQVKPGRQMVVQTYIGRDDPPSSFHALTDKLSRVIDRQEDKNRLEEAKAELERAKKNHEITKSQFAAIDTRNAADWKRMGKKGDPTLSKSEQEAKNNLANNLKAGGASIAHWEQEIAELEASIARAD